MSWGQELKDFFSGCQKAAVLGIGSALCGDDAAGMLCSEELLAMELPRERLLALAGSTAPENFTGVIKDFAPEALLMVDAAYMDAEVGQIRRLEADDIRSSRLSTHTLPLPVLMDYLSAETGCRIAVFGIQPGNTDFATEPCPEVREAARRLAETIGDSIFSR